MQDFTYLLHYLQAGAEQLEEYLLSDQLFWNLSINPPAGGPMYPNLTLGGLLLTKAQLRPLASTIAQNAEFTQVCNSIDLLHTKWKVAWQKKASWEFKSRLAQWQNFINDLRDNPGEFTTDYAYNVRIRVMIALLQPELDEVLPAYSDLLSTLDRFIRAKLIPGEFCWEAELAPGFPQSEYWYLWGYLSE